MSHGLLRGAFRAPDAICPLRSYLRQRDELVGERSRAVHHAQKALTGQDRGGCVPGRPLQSGQWRAEP